MIQAVAFSSDGSLLATADSNGNAYVWSVATGKLDFTLRGPGPGSGGGVADVVFSAHGYLVATADSNGNTYVWTVATGKLAGVLHDPSRGGGGGGVAGVAFSPDGSLLASAYINGRVYVWRTGFDGLLGFWFRGPPRRSHPPQLTRLSRPWVRAPTSSWIKRSLM